MIPTKDDLIYEVCSTLGRSEDDAVLSLVDKLLLMFERQQLLQQTDCSTLRELLAEMLSKEKKQFDDFSKDYFKRLRHAQNVTSITDVMRMIDERQPIA